MEFILFFYNTHNTNIIIIKQKPILQKICLSKLKQVSN